MDKKIKINLAGTLFQIDEGAYQILRDYLQAINNRFTNIDGGLETIEDIEARIAEIFQSQKGLTGVIEKENVEKMISIIGKPEDFDLNEPEAGSPGYTYRRKRLYRNPDDSIIGGVSGGIGAYLNTDPVLFRILFILFTIFFGVGFFIYIALWIALPPANTDARKREMHGDSFQSSREQNRKTATYTSEPPSYTTGYYNTSRVGNAFNEVFRAIVKVFYIIIRISLIIIGISLVLTGFMIIVSFVMIFIFKYSGSFSIDAFDLNLVYLPDFLNYIVNPAATPWILALILVVLALPLLALIYWGVKMIFWFRAKDGILSLSGLVLWVMSLTALALILFNEGISFAETSGSSSKKILAHTPDTLYITAVKKVSGLRFTKEFSLKEKGYYVFINEENSELYTRPVMKVNRSDDEIIQIEIRKRSSGRSQTEALKKSEELIYNYEINCDTLFLDEYFTIPSERKWSADYIGISLSIPTGTVIKPDRPSFNLIHPGFSNEPEEEIDLTRSESGYLSLIMTEDGLKILDKDSAIRK
jgi:phage shock protein PspC (stress-responsive transcriptional regulator)